MVEPTARTDRLRLEPLGPGHVEELVELLSAPGLHRHIAGEPPTSDELRRRFGRLAAGSPDPATEWRNWVMRRTSDEQAVGWLQATLTGASPRRADVAWVVGEPFQERGFATEAARWLLDELARLGVEAASASIAPGNAASEAVARHLGMTAGGSVDGEVRWTRELDYCGEDFYCDVALRDPSALQVVRQTSRVLAYHHTRPHWPVHIVVVPKRHIASLTTVGQEDEQDVRDLLRVVQEVAAEVEHEHGAARVLTNLGRYQDSKHLHVHVASGDPLGRASSGDDQLK